MARTPAQQKSSDVPKLFTAHSSDVAAAFSAERNEATFAPERALQLGYVKLGTDHPRPQSGVQYDIISASSTQVGSVAYPATIYRRMHMDVYAFFIDEMPDSFLAPNNEGLLKVEVSTKDPQNLAGSTFDAAFVTEFSGPDGSYAPTFLYRGVFRNVLIQDWVNLKFELYELDTDASEYYAKIKSVLDRVPEVKSLDILKGIPYLNLATNLFEGIIETFGKNPDDHLWGELPILEVQPTPGGAFLRSGIYVLGEKVNSNEYEIKLEDLAYKDERVIHKAGKQLPNHLLFGVSLVEHAP